MEEQAASQHLLSIYPTIIKYGSRKQHPLNHRTERAACQIPKWYFLRIISRTTVLPTGRSFSNFPLEKAQVKLQVLPFSYNILWPTCGTLGVATIFRQPGQFPENRIMMNCQPKQYTTIGEIPQNYHRFAKFDPPLSKNG